MEVKKLPSRSERIRDSWTRCRALQVDPKNPKVRRVSPDELERRLRDNRELVDAGKLHLDNVSARLDVEHVAYLTDADGVILYSTGSGRLVVAQSLQPGVDWSEARMGTNGAGTALALGHAVAVIADEHYCEAWQDSTCTAAVVCAEGRVQGAVDITTSVEDGNPERIALAEHLAFSIERELGARARQRADRELEVLAQAGQLFAASLDYKQTLATVAQLAVDLFADFCIVDVLDRDGLVERVAVSHAEPGQAAVAEQLAASPVNEDRPAPLREVLSSRKSRLVAEITSEIRATMGETAYQRRVITDVKPTSGMWVPLLARGRLLGALGFLSVKPDRQFDAHDLRLAEEIAQRAAISVDNARLYQEAQHASRARDEVLGVVAHDLRNSMLAAEAWLGLLQQAIPKPIPEAQRALGHLTELTTRMDRLMRDLLDVARIARGRLTLSRREHDARELARSAVELAEPLAHESGVELRLELAGPCMVLADRDRILRVLANLVDNAVKFMSEGGTVTVHTVQEGDQVVFSVQDTGPGVPVQEQRHLFEPYWQGGSSSSGAGLGLSICRALVEAHGGRIWLESPPGRGARFSFALPCA